MGFSLSGAANSFAALGLRPAIALGSPLFDGLHASLALDGAAIKPPCRMAERRHGDREADEERQRCENERRGDDQPP